MSKVSVLGYGTIGSGVVKVLSENSKLIEKRVGEKVEVKSVLDLRDFPGDMVENILVHDFKEIENDDEVDIVVETMGGLHPAYEFVKASLEAGKSVCTSNKALVADFGVELLEIARKNNVSFLFEASVGGGIPIIRPMRTSLNPEEICEISGILNGTTNYILTEMTKKGADFKSVLKDAQEKGYAEKDPTADIEGHDAGRKIAILTSLAYARQLDFEDVYMEGITNISDRDINYAKKMDGKIKIFGTSKKEGDNISAMVTPRLIDSTHPLFSVDGVYNAILVKGNMVGDVMFYGQGAGKEATASAVVSDVMECAVNKGKNIDTPWSGEKLTLVPFENTVSQFFIRVKSNEADKAKEIFEITKVVDAGYEDEFAFITSDITEGEYKKKSQEIDIINKIRLA